MTGAPGESPDPARLMAVRRRRRRQFLTHLLAYFAVMVVLVPLNATVSPDRPWFLLPMVGWGAPLAIHAAWVVELFGRPKA